MPKGPGDHLVAGQPCFCYRLKAIDWITLTDCNVFVPAKNRLNIINYENTLNLLASLERHNVFKSYIASSGKTERSGLTAEPSCLGLAVLAVITATFE